MLKPITVLSCLFLLSCDVSKSTYPKDLSGMWRGDREESGVRTVFIVFHAPSGRFYARHEEYEGDALVKYMNQYGFWQQDRNTYQSEIAIVVTPEGTRGAEGCEFLTLNYEITSYVEGTLSYRSLKSGREYKKRRLAPGYDGPFGPDSKLTSEVNELLDGIERQCKNET